MASTPNPEKSSGAPFEEDGELHRYARIATVSFDPPVAGTWSTRVSSAIKVEAVVSLEVLNRNTNKWVAISGKPLFTSSYSRRVEGAIDDEGKVTVEYDDSSPRADPDNHLSAIIDPNPNGNEAVTMTGPHGEKAPYNLPADTMNARCVFQKRQGAAGEKIVVTNAETLDKHQKQGHSP
jgi:hypothetical protein